MIYYQINTKENETKNEILYNFIQKNPISVDDKRQNIYSTIRQCWNHHNTLRSMDNVAVVL